MIHKLFLSLLWVILIPVIWDFLSAKVDFKKAKPVFVKLDNAFNWLFFLTLPVLIIIGILDIWF